MLVLERKQGERIIIDGGRIVVTVVETGHKTRIGIDAPRDVKIQREEIYHGPSISSDRPASD